MFIKDSIPPTCTRQITECLRLTPQGYALYKHLEGYPPLRAGEL